MAEGKGHKQAGAAIFETVDHITSVRLLVEQCQLVMSIVRQSLQSGPCKPWPRWGFAETSERRLKFCI